MSKKSYMSLLKEAIAEFDTSDHLDVKGPMLDPIISWDGAGELPTSKDAASVLERYYFNEKQDDGVKTIEEMDYENDKGDAKGESMEDTEGTGTSQAGTSKSDSIAGAKKEREKEIAKEDEDLFEQEDKEEDEDEEESEEVSEDLEMENAIIEKLIAEMEDEDLSEAEEVDEADMTYTGSGPKDPAPKEKKATSAEEDAKGAGTEQAGTGPDEGEIPDRKDIHDKLVKPKEYTDESALIDETIELIKKELLEQDDEGDEAPVPTGDEGSDEEDKELDVDKEMTKEQTDPSAVPGGPSPKKKGEDYEDDEEAYAEAFEIFKEEIQYSDEDPVQ